MHHFEESPSEIAYRSLIPQPDAEGIAKTQELYFTKCGRHISEDEARDVLGRVMRYIYALNFPCSSSDSTPENPTTTAQ